MQMMLDTVEDFAGRYTIFFSTDPDLRKSKSKCTWSCPKWTRTFLVQKVLACGMRSARTEILSRYVKFCLGQRTSDSQEIRVLFNHVARDLQCTTAKNIKMGA